GQVEEDARVRREVVGRLDERERVAGKSFGLGDVARARERLRTSGPPEHVAVELVCGRLAGGNIRKPERLVVLSQLQQDMSELDLGGQPPAALAALVEDRPGSAVVAFGSFEVACERFHVSAETRAETVVGHETELRQDPFRLRDSGARFSEI